MIAAIDEKSLTDLGRWPWPRDVMAGPVEKLTTAGVEIIIFDVMFAEEEKNDAMLGNAVGNAGNVLLPIVFDFEKAATPGKREKGLLAGFSLYPEGTRPAPSSAGGGDQFPITAKGVLMPVPALAEEAMGPGHINMILDADGSLRWKSLAIGYDGALYPSIALQAEVTVLFSDIKGFTTFSEKHGPAFPAS